MNDQTKITFPLNLVNGMLQYLGTRPYGEVFQLVQAIQSVAAPQIPADAPSESTADGAV
jgi:hypothetical protein